MTTDTQRPATAPPTEMPSLQDTVTRMQEHYRQTGSYLAQDVKRVLGDPRDSVAATVTPNRVESMKQLDVYSLSRAISSKVQT